MSKGRYSITFTSADEGHAWNRYFDTYGEASRAYELGLCLSYLINGIFDPQGKRIKSLGTIRREEAADKRREQARHLERDRVRRADVDAHPAERATAGIMKLLWIGIGVLILFFLISL